MVFVPLIRTPCHFLTRAAFAQVLLLSAHPTQKWHPVVQQSVGLLCVQEPNVPSRTMEHRSYHGESVTNA